MKYKVILRNAAATKGGDIEVVDASSRDDAIEQALAIAATDAPSLTVVVDVYQQV